MPLVSSALAADLQAIAEDPPESAAGCAAEWADAIQSYAAGVVPSSTTVAAAATALQAALAGAFAARPADSALEAAFASFALTLGGGMTGFVATPPAGLVGFATLFAGPNATSHAAGASAVATLIDTWMRTGTATPTGGGPATPWS